MRMRKVAKLQNDILLNIQYFRLKEEVCGTQAKIDTIKAKKDFALLDVLGRNKKKSIEHNQSFIDTVNKAIKDMETDNKKYDESIIDKNLAILNGCSDYNFIAYKIAVCTVLDITVPYCNTDDYLEKLSGKLFDDTTKIASIIKQRDKILAALNCTNLSFDEDAQENKIVNGTQIISNMAIFSLLKSKLKSKFTSSAKTIVLVASMAINLGIQSGVHFINKIRGRQNFKKLDSDSLDYILVTNLLLMAATNDLIAEKKLTELDYQKLFVNKMEVIDTYRKSIHYDLFHKWKNRNENIKKIHLLYGFDSYVVKNLIPLEKR